MGPHSKKLDWIDALKAFAILGILLNHAVETFQSYPWFTNPSSDWPSFAERMANIFPKDGSLIARLTQFLGWLGDMSPGIFIFVSGLTLTISAFQKPQNTLDFYKTRALRIYPLYVVIHLIILISAFVFFDWGSKFLLLMSPISMLGLRFTNSLFEFLNPSWWFIWLIIQMYIFFPFLLNLLKQKGPVIFIGVTLFITVISRIAGISGYTLSAELYYWMTGLFAGTRLFEFAFGMFIGYLVYQNNSRLSVILENKIRLLLLSILIYLTGFVASWTYLGCLFSNMLITIGLSGISFSIYILFFRRNRTAKNSIIWIGRNSFGAFLIHQPFMIYFGSQLSGIDKILVLAVIIPLSFLIGQLIEKLVNIIITLIQLKLNFILGLFKEKFGLILLAGSISVTILISTLVLWGKIYNSIYILFFFVLQIVYLSFYRIIVKPKLRQWTYRYIDISIILSTLILLVNAIWLPLFSFLLIIAYLFLTVFIKFNHWRSVILTVFLLIGLIGIIELYLTKNKHRESNEWGEISALQIDTITTYSLIPNKNTHLKYNNYDYFVKTNSYGFASPEIDLEKKEENEIRIMILGDAFSMPEGMEYQSSYPAILEKLLRQEFPEKIINVINGGVTGYGPIEEQAQLEKYIDIVNPNIIINELFINEFSEINISQKSRLLDIGLIDEKFYKKRFFSNSMLPREVSSIINGFFESKTDDSFRYVMSLLPLYETNSYMYSDSVITKLNTYLVEMNYLASGKDALYVVMGVPGQIEVSQPQHISYYPYNENLTDTAKFNLDRPLKIFNELCLKNSIPYLDTKNYLKAHPSQPLYFEKSWHWNKTGHQAIAKLITNYIKENGMLTQRSLPNPE